MRFDEARHGRAAAYAETVDLGGRLVVPGFVESHIHLDKACILERCAAEQGTLAEAIREVSRAKREFTVADIRARAIDVRPNPSPARRASQARKSAGRSRASSAKPGAPPRCGARNAMNDPRSRS